MSCESCDLFLLSYRDLTDLCQAPAVKTEYERLPHTTSPGSCSFVLRYIGYFADLPAALDQIRLYQICRFNVVIYFF